MKDGSILSFFLSSKGRANLDFTLKGSNGVGKVHMEAYRKDREWEFVALELRRDGHEVVDLKTYESVKGFESTHPTN
jgi:hypothetical protein